jgi:hypothetical protein
LLPLQFLLAVRAAAANTAAECSLALLHQRGCQCIYNIHSAAHVLCQCLSQRTLQWSKVLRTLLGSFRGRAVTMGSLAEELGLPWTLLQRLFRQHMDYRAASAASSTTEQARQAMQERYTAAADETLRLAQDAAGTATQLQVSGATAVRREMRYLQERIGEEAQEQQEYGGNAAAAGGGAAAAGDAANDAAAAAPLDPQQQLVNQLNAQLQQQNQQNAQVAAAMQLVQQMVQQMQQAGAAEADIAQFEAQAIANIQQQQAGNAQPEVLPTEDYNADAVVLRQLQARLDAGERSIAVPKQAQPGPLPLWQQCVLEMAANHMGLLHDSVEDNGLYAYLTSGMLVADSAAAAASAEADEGVVTTPLQRLLGDEAFVTGPPVSPQPGRLPWGRLLAQAAVELRQPQLLAWALTEQQQQRLWGSAHNAAKAALWDLSSKENCTPISNAVSRHPQQQRADMQQLQIYRQQQLPGRPMFAQLAANTALLLLNITPNAEGLLSDWLQHGLHPGSNEADLVRAKAVLAAVVGAEQLPAGAQLMRRDCLKQVQRVGDVDLLALVVFWGHRMPHVPDGM